MFKFFKHTYSCMHFASKSYPKKFYWNLYWTIVNCTLSINLSFGRNGIILLFNYWKSSLNRLLCLTISNTSTLVCTLQVRHALKKFYWNSYRTVVFCTFSINLTVLRETELYFYLIIEKVILIGFCVWLFQTHVLLYALCK